MTHEQAPVDAGAAGVARTLLRNLAFQDVGALLFHGYLALRVMAAPDSPDAVFARRFAMALVLITATTLVLTRGELLRPGRLRALVYRVGLFTPVPLSYFLLRSLLPALQPELLDTHLWAIDEAIFGTTPAVWLNRLNTPAAIEWFSFFYYCYFYLMAAMLIPPLFLDRGLRLQQLMIGGLMVAAIGHCTYTLVPGRGPYSVLDLEPIHGGFFWQQVIVTVQSAGAQLDIFPSLHTAYPVFFALHAFGWRRTKPYKYVWPVVAFMAANIIVATMLLRWHWGIDVIAGLCLAGIARLTAVVVSQREAQRGDRQPVWEPYGEEPEAEAAADVAAT